MGSQRAHLCQADKCLLDLIDTFTNIVLVATILEYLISSSAKREEATLTPLQLGLPRFILLFF